jgi:glycosyltransferase 2 family protein
MLAVPFWLAGTDWLRTLESLRWCTAGVLTSMIVVGWAFNTTRLRILLHSLGRRVGVIHGALIVISAEFAGAATPGAAGMPATYAYLFTDLGLQLGTAAGLIAVIVLFDILFFAAIMALSVALLFVESGHFSRVMVISTIVLAGAAFALWLLHRYYRAIIRIAGRTLTRIPWLRKYRVRLTRTAVDFLKAMRLLGRMTPLQQAGLLLTTTGYWMPRYGVLVIAISVVGGAVPAPYLFLIQGLLNLGGQAVLLPGGGGGVDAVYGLLMGPYLDHREIAFTLVVWRAFTYYWYLAIGGPIFFFKAGEAAHHLLQRRRR